MRKAIQLEVRVWVVGEDEPGHDWATRTAKAIRDIITAGAKAHPELRVKVRTIRERS